MSDKITDSLNPRQKEAVCWCDGPELVLAGAGSGKTRVLTAKIAYLINNMNVAPWSILALTFTNKAAREMKSRVESLIGDNLRGMEVSTFHAYGLRFLHRYRDSLEALGYPRSFVIFDRSDCRGIVKKILSDLDIDSKRLDVGEALEIISNAKAASNPVSREPKIDARWRELYDRYQKSLISQGALDFDDLMILPLNIIARDKIVRDSERARIDWVLVDEYQDVNMPQYLLLRLLVDEKKRLMVVGDPDQSIYGWRGADMTMIMNFEKDFKGAKTVILDQNYRSTGNILDGANGVIRNNSDRRPKDLWTASDRGEKIQIFRAKNDLSESAWISKKIDELHEAGYKFSEMAILYRMNVLSRGLENVMLEHNVPYRVIRGVAFYDRMEVKDAISMMRLAINPRDTVSLARVANVPHRALGKKSVTLLTNVLAATAGKDAETVWKEVQENGGGLSGKAGSGAKRLAEDMLSLINVSSDVNSVIDNILYSIGYEDYLRSKAPDDFDERIANVMEILSIVPDNGDMEQVLTEIPLVTDQDEGSGGDDCISMLTLHAAKGLEFPIVFMAGMEEGVFPSSRSVAGESDISEERRLCYVGMTRARERLFMSGASSRLLFGGIQRNTSSRFIGEIPQSCVELNDETVGGVYYADDRSHGRRWRW